MTQCAQRLSASKRVTRSGASRSLRTTGCSTPFGIKEGYTLNAHGRGTLQSVCSTPFGIKEGYTRVGPQQAPGAARVLNAFRHQRGLHAVVPLKQRDDFLVLNAFRHQRGLHTPTVAVDTTNQRCSTPFGIKEGYTRGLAGLLRPRVVVLNAFRHQRGLHRLERPRIERGQDVLNAFRHQRGLHPRSSAFATPSKDRCSTPFGIKEGYTRRDRSARSGRLVLNAFRHQRGLHSLSMICSSKSIMCSTPFGIKEGYTTPLKLFPSFVVCAQRLSASKRVTRMRRVISPLRSTGAQRLSASKRVTQRPISFGNNRIKRCSTPFGIKEGYTVLAGDQYALFHGCSTPFGIKEGYTCIRR